MPLADTLLQRLRDAHRLSRLVLAGFALFLGLALLSSAMIRANPLDEICHAAGSVDVHAVGIDGDSHAGHDGMDDMGAMPMMGHHGPNCVLCLALGVAPPLPTVAYRPPLAPAPVPEIRPFVPVQAFVARPLPARGPPVVT